MRCYQFINGVNGVFQPECTGEQCPKWWKKTGMCMELINTLNLKSIQWNAEHKGKANEDGKEIPPNVP